jgi:hypothetical protein
MLFALSAAAAFVWFFPATRDSARATWHRATVHARRVLVAVGVGRDQEP